MLIRKSTVTLTLLLFLIYVAFGDVLLPGAMGASSTHVRNRLNQALLSLVPSWHPKVDPYQRTEKALPENN